MGDGKRHRGDLIAILRIKQIYKANLGMYLVFLSPTVMCYIQRAMYGSYKAMTNV